MREEGTDKFDRHGKNDKEQECSQGGVEMAWRVIRIKKERLLSKRSIRTFIQLQLSTLKYEWTVAELVDLHA